MSFFRFKQLNTNSFFLLFILCTQVALSQITKSIKVRKENDLIVFYQKGKKCDSLSMKKDHYFVLIVPKTLKETIHISIENGQLVQTKNDSLFKLNLLPGMKYESLWEKDERKNNHFKTLVNGTNEAVQQKLEVKFFETSKASVLMEKTFFIVP